MCLAYPSVWLESTVDCIASVEHKSVGLQSSRNIGFGRPASTQLSSYGELGRGQGRLTGRPGCSGLASLGDGVPPPFKG